MDRPPHVPQPETELEEFFDLSIDPLSIIGFDGEFKRVNASFVRLLGYTKPELFSRTALDILHPDDVEAAREALAQLAEGHDLVGFEARVICADGSVRWLEWNTRSMPERGVVYSVGRDTTERRRVDAELREAQRLLEASRDELRVLADEQAALRRVATLVAQDVPSSELFGAVAREVGTLLGADFSGMIRYEDDASVTTVATWAAAGEHPAGSHSLGHGAGRSGVDHRGHARGRARGRLDERSRSDGGGHPQRARGELVGRLPDRGGGPIVGRPGRPLQAEPASAAGHGVACCAVHRLGRHRDRQRGVAREGGPARGGAGCAAAGGGTRRAQSSPQRGLHGRHSGGRAAPRCRPCGIATSSKGTARRGRSPAGAAAAPFCRSGHGFTDGDNLAARIVREPARRRECTATTRRGRVRQRISHGVRACARPSGRRSSSTGGSGVR